MTTLDREAGETLGVCRARRRANESTLAMALRYGATSLDVLQSGANAAVSAVTSSSFSRSASSTRSPFRGRSRHGTRKSTARRPRLDLCLTNHRQAVDIDRICSGWGG